MRLILLAFAAITPMMAGCGGGDQPTVTTTTNEIQAFNEANPGALASDDDDGADGP